MLSVCFHQLQNLSNGSGKAIGDAAMTNESGVPPGGYAQCLEARVLELLGRVDHLQAEMARIAQENNVREGRISSRLHLLNLRVRVLEAKLPDLCRRFKARWLHFCALMGLPSSLCRDGASGAATRSAA